MSFFVTSQKKRRISTPVVPPTPPVSGDWWLAGGVNASDCLAAYQSIGADSYVASKVNLANPGTYDIADGASYPTWNAATGWTFDGISTYLDTNITTEDIGRGTGTFIFSGTRLLDKNDSYYMGSIVYDNAEDLNYLGILTIYLNSGIIVSEYNDTSTAPATFVGIPSCIITMAGQDLYKNGVLANTATASWVGNFNSKNILLGAASAYITLENTYSYFYANCDIQASAFYNTILTSTQIAAITLAIQSL